ncbi:MAG TPA: replication-relaxation family protein [Candidatus Dormibacteraeota bacterium]|nr:replication-relaxation family protein [Candidatus Dormibacteraeota bacterium]
MNHRQPKYRRALNDSQIDLLKFLYKYRFSSGQMIAQYFNKPSAKYVQKRLAILEDQGFIAKHYPKSYKLQGLPAAYFLLPKAARLLQSKAPELVPDQAIKNRYRDKTASEAFMTHCLNLGTSCLKLKSIYADKLNCFTQSDIRLEKYDYFPKWLPDAFISLKPVTKGANKHFFLDYFEDSTPFFVLVRRIKSYLTYAKDGEWEVTNRPLPTILLISETAATQKRLRRRIQKELNDTWDEEIAKFYTTTKEQLFSMTQTNDKIWQQPANPKVSDSLRQM